MEPNPLLGPVVALVGWTLIVLIIAIFQTQRALKGADLKGLGRGARARDLEGRIAPEATFARRNYEHLCEQPLLFYALMLALVAMGDGNVINLWLGWAYVILRAIHSLVQIRGGKRGLWFGLSSLVLLALVVHAGLELAYHL